LILFIFKHYLFFHKYKIKNQFKLLKNFHNVIVLVFLWKQNNIFSFIPLNYGAWMPLLHNGTSHPAFLHKDLIRELNAIMLRMSSLTFSSCFLAFRVHFAKHSFFASSIKIWTREKFFNFTYIPALLCQKL
jgi:hypothetical protein